MKSLLEVQVPLPRSHRLSALETTLNVPPLEDRMTLNQSELDAASIFSFKKN